MATPPPVRVRLNSLAWEFTGPCYECGRDVMRIGTTSAYFEALKNAYEKGGGEEAIQKAFPKIICDGCCRSKFGEGTDPTMLWGPGSWGYF